MRDGVQWQTVRLDVALLTPAAATPVNVITVDLFRKPNGERGFPTCTGHQADDHRMGIRLRGGSPDPHQLANQSHLA